MTEHPEIRASDAERKTVVDELARQCGEGRLTIDETEERVAAAWSARTVSDLQHLLHDLPTSRDLLRRRPAGAPVRRSALSQRSAFAVHLRVYAVVIGFLCLIWLLTSPGGYFWPIWPALGWGLGVALHKVAE